MWMIALRCILNQFSVITILRMLYNKHRSLSQLSLLIVIRSSSGDCICSVEFICEIIARSCIDRNSIIDIL